MADDSGAWCTLTTAGDGRSLRLPTVRILARQPDGRTIEAPLDLRPCLVGSRPDCDLVVSDPAVSRVHCELRLTDRGVAVRDLGSKNGVTIGGVPVLEGWIPPGSAAVVGGTELRVSSSGAASVVALSAEDTFGEAVGQSPRMRALFAKLERVAPTDETVLLLGESGTGKELVARALHARYRGGRGPFTVIDCGAIPEGLVESELFGHKKGSFASAYSDRAGLLEEASGGTLFIDEIGELPLAMQPKLLRAIQERQIKRVGENHYRSFDARIVAATHRNLRARVQENAFRQDLYYRLSVAELHVPALRERKEDIPLLVTRFLAERDPPRTLEDLPPRTLDLFAAYDWPGNVRELRNVVARLLLFPEAASDLVGAAPPAAPAGAPQFDELLALSLPDARETVMSTFERAYLVEKLKQHGGNIKETAKAIGVSRQLVHRLLERYDLRV